jgi:hypothetical protein
MIETQSLLTRRYGFVQHTRRMVRVAMLAAILFFISIVIVLLAILKALPVGLGSLVALAGIVSVLSFILLLPLLVFLFLYGRGGLWFNEQGVRVHFPGEAEQAIDWSDALYAVDEGDEYLASSKGKEGLGHLVGKEYYLRLHLEGMTPEQRAEIKGILAEHVEVRRPRLFTFATLLNTKGETVARGRLYAFEDALLCAENRGKRRVFIAAPIRKLTSVRSRDPFTVGRLLCESFLIVYEKKEFVVMLGYEMTFNTGLGSSSRWSATGSAQDWIDALQPLPR